MNTTAWEDIECSYTALGRSFGTMKVRRRGLTPQRGPALHRGPAPRRDAAPRRGPASTVIKSLMDSFH
jgi:hypothetical protein